MIVRLGRFYRGDRGARCPRCVTTSYRIGFAELDQAKAAGAMERVG
jgi:hypothetical protein